MSGIRNKRWSRANVTINQVWHTRRAPDEMWTVYQCHHADECIEMVRTDAGALNRERTLVVGVTELRKYWERVA